MPQLRYPHGKAMVQQCQSIINLTDTPLQNVGDSNILQILKQRWWKYLILGLVDVEANYAVVKAYQYTTITSIQVGIS